MFELRWRGVPETTTKGPVLEYREMTTRYDEKDGWIDCWTDWEPVPLVIIPKNSPDA